MSLIKIERMYYSQKGEYLPVEGEFYINPDEIRSVSMESSIVNKGIHYEVTLKGGKIYFISEACFKNILRLNNGTATLGSPDEIVKAERPKKPEINPGHPIKQMF